MTKILTYLNSWSETNRETTVSLSNFILFLLIADPEFSIVHIPPSRHTRSLNSIEHRLDIEAPSLDRKFELLLVPSPELVAPGFRYIARYRNSTKDIPHDLENCYWRGEDSALSLCNGIVSNLNYKTKYVYLYICLMIILLGTGHSWFFIYWLLWTLKYLETKENK